MIFCTTCPQAETINPPAHCLQLGKILRKLLHQKGIIHGNSLFRPVTCRIHRSFKLAEKTATPANQLG